jgi:hypothetical protein
MAFRNVRIVLRTLVRVLRNEISGALARRSSYLSTFKKIDLTRGVYFLVSIPEAEVKLISVWPDFGMSVALSIDDTRQLFRSIQRAYDHRELVELKLGDLSWKTDCRVRSNPDKMIISFRRGVERTRVDIKRQDIAAAMANFRNLFETK